VKLASPQNVTVVRGMATVTIVDADLLPHPAEGSDA
jgi:hypothetical protein